MTKKQNYEQNLVKKTAQKRVFVKFFLSPVSELK